MKQSEGFKDYDAIIVGSGAGGLTAAVALAQAGKKVLVLEQHDLHGWGPIRSRRMAIASAPAQSQPKNSRHFLYRVTQGYPGKQTCSSVGLLAANDQGHSTQNDCYTGVKERYLCCLDSLSSDSIGFGKKGKQNNQFTGYDDQARYVIFRRHSFVHVYPAIISSTARPGSRRPNNISHPCDER